MREYLTFGDKSNRRMMENFSDVLIVKNSQHKGLCNITQLIYYYRFSYKDFGLCSQIKIRPQRTNVRLRIFLIWGLVKIFITTDLVIKILARRQIKIIRRRTIVR